MLRLLSFIGLPVVIAGVVAQVGDYVPDDPLSAFSEFGALGAIVILLTFMVVYLLRELRAAREAHIADLRQFRRLENDHPPAPIEPKNSVSGVSLPGNSPKTTPT